MIPQNHKPSEDPAVLGRLKRLASSQGLNISLLGRLAEVEPQPAPSLVEQFQTAVSKRSASMTDLAQVLGERAVLEALSLPARLGDLDEHVLAQVLDLDLGILDRLAGVDVDVVLAVVPAVTRRAFHDPRDGFKARRSLQRSDVLDKLFATELPGNLLVRLVVERDEDYGRDNLTGSFRPDQIDILRERFESVTGFTSKHRTLLDTAGTLQLLEHGTMGAARLAYQLGVLDVLVGERLLEIVTAPGDLLELFSLTASEGTSRTLERLLVPVVSRLAVNDPSAVTSYLRGDSFWNHLLVPCLLSRVPLPTAVLVEALAQADSSSVARWARGGYSSNPFETPAAQVWASRQASLDHVQRCVSSTSSAEFNRVVTTSVKGVAALLTAALRLASGRGDTFVQALLPHVAETFAGDDRLWERLLDATETSPFGNESLTLPEAVQIYQDRWAAQAARKS